MDDYFVPGVIPPDENGRVDFEAPARVDCELLKKDLRTLAAGGEVRLPKFNLPIIQDSTATQYDATATR